MPEIRIEAKPLNILGFTFYHMYLVYRDDSENEWIIRGGPDGSYFSSGGAFAYQINTEIELSLDARGTATPADRFSTVLDTGDLSADEAWAIMVRYAAEMEALDYPTYQLFGTNSNALAGALMGSVGLNPDAGLPGPIGTGDVPGFTSYATMLSEVVPPPDGSVLGTEDDDEITGIQISETIYGFAGADDIDGGGGDDLIHGGLGDDTINGGVGADVAFFTGSFFDYTLQVDAGTLTVFSSTTDDAGTDQITNVEVLRFLDGSFDGTIFTADVVTDDANSFGWTSYFDRYDIDGDRVSRNITYDSGRLAEMNFTNGVRVSILVTDAADDFVWTSLEKQFDDNGRLSKHNWVFDDGRTVETAFVAGNKVSNLVTDAADEFVWATLDKRFDDDGVITSQTNTYDDGRVLEIAFANGVRSSASMTDVADAYGWASFVEGYDSGGNRVDRLITFDDGSESLIVF